VNIRQHRSRFLSRLAGRPAAARPNRRDPSILT